MAPVATETNLITGFGLSTIKVKSQKILPLNESGCRAQPYASCEKDVRQLTAATSPFRGNEKASIYEKQHGWMELQQALPAAAAAEGAVVPADWALTGDITHLQWQQLPQQRLKDPSKTRHRQQQQQVGYMPIYVESANLHQHYQAAAQQHHRTQQHSANGNILRMRLARAKQSQAVCSKAIKLLVNEPAQRLKQQQEVQSQQALSAPLTMAASSKQHEQEQSRFLSAAAVDDTPSLPAVTLVVKLLLQLAALKLSATYADQLRQHLLQQVKQAATTAKEHGRSFSVAVALYELLSPLRSQVLQACRQPRQTTATDENDSAAAQAAIAEAPHSGFRQPSATLLVEARHGMVERAQLPRCRALPSSASSHQEHLQAIAEAEAASTEAASVAAAAAVELALSTAACEAQLMGLHVTSTAHADKHSHQCMQTVDVEALLQAELALALSEQQ